MTTLAEPDAGLGESAALRQRMEAVILRLLQERREGGSLCPSEAARELARSEAQPAWRPLMDLVRSVAHDLAATGTIAVTQRGRTVDAITAKGPIRLRLR